MVLVAGGWLDRSDSRATSHGCPHPSAASRLPPSPAGRGKRRRRRQRVSTAMVDRFEAGTCYRRHIRKSLFSFCLGFRRLLEHEDAKGCGGWCATVESRTKVTSYRGCSRCRRSQCKRARRCRQALSSLRSRSADHTSSSSPGPTISSSLTFSVRWRMARSRRSAMSRFSRR